MNKNNEISDQIHEIASKTKAIADLMWAGTKGIETAEKTLSDLGWYFYDSMSRIEELADQIK
jgi:hypothetical protein